MSFSIPLNKEIIVTLVGLLFTGLSVVLVFAFANHRYSRYRKFLEREALKLNGRVTAANKYSIPNLYCTYRDVDLNVYVTPMRSGRVYSQPSTLHILAYFPWQVPYWFCLYPRNNPPAIVNEQAAGQEVFTEKLTYGYLVKSNETDFVQSVLTYDCRSTLKQIISEKPVVVFEKNIFRISVPFPMISDDVFLKVFEPAKSLISRLNEVGQYQ